MSGSFIKRDMAKTAAEWLPTAYAGVFQRTSRRPGNARNAVLLKIEPGARIPPYLHPEWEAITVLEGRLCTDAGHWHGPGSYLDAPPNHAWGVHSDTGALVLARLGRPKPG